VASAEQEGNNKAERWKWDYKTAGPIRLHYLWKYYCFTM